MKNPFPEVKAAHVCVINPLTDGEYSLYWVRGVDEQQLGMSEEQAKYAARAINQHDKMVLFCHEVMAHNPANNPGHCESEVYAAFDHLVSMAAKLLKAEIEQEMQHETPQQPPVGPGPRPRLRG